MLSSLKSKHDGNINAHVSEVNGSLCFSKGNRLIDCILFNAVFNSISVISKWPVHLSMLSWTRHNILFKQLAAFPYNHCRNNELRRERNESCGNDYHQSSETILAKPGIEPATSCSQIHNT